MDVAENPKVAHAMQIIHDYFASEGQSEEQIAISTNTLAEMVQDPGAKLVQFGNMLFLVLVRDKGAIEFHTMGMEADPRDTVKRFLELRDYLKGIGVKVAYSYSNDPKFKRIARMTGLDLKIVDIDIDGEPTTAYILEM